MSDSRLIKWFESLLFGGGFEAPPCQVQSFLLRMESEGIPWSHIMESGGLTEFPHDVHGDLNTLIDALEMGSEEPRSFKTRAVTRFWDDLRLLLARQKPERVPMPTASDDEALQLLLTGCSQPLRFESAEFWGDVARRFINLRRSSQVTDLPSCDSGRERRALRLYRMTCYARGQYLDPFDLHLVPHAEYLNAVHWQTLPALEAFMAQSPRHALSVTVRQLLNRTVEQLLRAETPTGYASNAQLDAFFYNIQKIHDHVEKVEEKVPPRLIDVVQRLITLTHLDGAWEKDPVVPTPSTSQVGLALLHLTEQVQMAERERRLLLLQ